MKLLKRVLVLILPLFFVLPLNAAHVGGEIPDKEDTNTCLLSEACDDQILLTGSVVMFEDLYKVDAIDINKQKVYNDRIGAWIPSYHLTKMFSIGMIDYTNQILDVGDLFCFMNETRYGDPNARHDFFQIRAIYTPNDTALIDFTDKSGNIYPTWIYANPTTEICANADF